MDTNGCMDKILVTNETKLAGHDRKILKIDPNEIQSSAFHENIDIDITPGTEDVTKHVPL